MVYTTLRFNQVQIISKKASSKHWFKMRRKHSTYLWISAFPFRVRYLFVNNLFFLPVLTKGLLRSHLFSFSSHLGQSCVFSSKLVNLSFQFFQFFPHRHAMDCIYRLFFLLFCDLALRNITYWLFTRWRLWWKRQHKIIRPTLNSRATDLIKNRIALLSQSCPSSLVGSEKAEEYQRKILLTQRELFM